MGITQVAEPLVPPEAAVRTVTMFTNTGRPIQVPLFEVWCPRCLRRWDCPQGMDDAIDEQAGRRAAVAECPGCVDASWDLWVADHPEHEAPEDPADRDEGW